MSYIDEQLKEFKNLIDQAILEGGTEGKNKMIKSSRPINLIHDAVKKELIKQKVEPTLICPRLGETKPEIRIAGHIKEKKQDVCVMPRNIEKKRMSIDWGPLAYLSNDDEYGYEYSNNILVINVRSQISSLAKNFDTLFERTIAEAQNLHIRYPNMVLGEVYLIPVYEYDNEEAKEKKVKFKKKQVNLEKYISFFSAINGRTLSTKKDLEGELANTKNAHLYERCALLIVDFSKKKPKLYTSSADLKKDGLISSNFPIEYAELGFASFAKDIVTIYAERFDEHNIINE